MIYISWSNYINNKQIIDTYNKVVLTFYTVRRRVEQLVARRAHNPKVIGSSPIPAIFYF